MKQRIRCKENKSCQREHYRAPSHTHPGESRDAQEEENAPCHAGKNGAWEAKLSIDADQSRGEEQQRGVGIGGHSGLNERYFPPTNNPLIGGNQAQAMNPGRGYNDLIGGVAMEPSR